MCTTFASPTRRKLDLLEGDSAPFYSSSPTSTHYTPQSLYRSRSSNYLRPAAPIHSTPFNTPPSTPPIAYHDLPTIALPTRAHIGTPATAPAPAPAPATAAATATAPATAPAPQYSAHPPHPHPHVHSLSRSQSLQAHARAQDAPPVPPIPQHFLAPPAPAPVPDEAPPSYAEIEWTVKVPQRRVSRREREQDQAYLLA